MLHEGVWSTYCVPSSQGDTLLLCSSRGPAEWGRDDWRHLWLFLGTMSLKQRPLGREYVAQLVRVLGVRDSDPALTVQARPLDAGLPSCRQLSEPHIPAWAAFMYLNPGCLLSAMKTAHAESRAVEASSNQDRMARSRRQLQGLPSPMQGLLLSW